MTAIQALPTLELPRPSPSEQAYLEILTLQSDPKLQPERMLGGPTPPDMLARNAEKSAEFRRRRFEIIAKHGVFDEYLEPLRTRETDLTRKLEEVRSDIAELERLQQAAAK